MKEPLRLMLVDDEELARARLRQLLAELAQEFPHRLVGEAGDGLAALAIAAREPIDIVLTDIRMPTMDGIELAQQLAASQQPPAIVFVTAYDEFAVKAFELAAADYLLKPVTRARLRTALQRAHRLTASELRSIAPQGRARLLVRERGQILLLPVEEILILRAEDKYVVARTAAREYLLDESLSRLEAEFADRFLRIHRRMLVARAAVIAARRLVAAEGDARWTLELRGVNEPLPISRRQWPLVKEALGL